MTYLVVQEKFEGPLDVLLNLVEGEKLSINEISLATVTDGFITYLKDLQSKGDVDQEMLAEFLVIASQLLLIKSRSLLPEFQISPEEEESILELETRLAEYKRLKELSLKLGTLSRGGQKSFSREAWAGETVVFLPPRKVTGKTLSRAFEGLLQTIPKVEKIIQEKIKRVISLEEKIKELQSILAKKFERVFSEMVAGAKEKIEVIVSFLALLELTKQKLVSVEQSKLFGDITVRKTKA